MTCRFYTEFRNEFPECRLARLGVQNTKCSSWLYCCFPLPFQCMSLNGAGTLHVCRIFFFFFNRYKILKQDSIVFMFFVFSPDMTLCC